MRKWKLHVHVGHWTSNNFNINMIKAAVRTYNAMLYSTYMVPVLVAALALDIE